MITTAKKVERLRAKLALICAVATYFVTCSMASAQDCTELWNGACFGMTVKQLAERFPNSTVLHPRPGETGKDGALELLRAADTTLWGTKFLPKFYFNEGRLSYVLLFPSIAVNGTREVQASFDALSRDLSSKYGEGTKAESVVSADMKMRAVTFIHGGVSTTAIEQYNSVIGTIVISNRAAEKTSDR